ncbi:hypothetical protein EDD21DRAFT_368082 [Dissophora ornata]|nr:hypothetical protein EDD21DRAFT_368082 [Dissophora ornata]
MPKFSERQEYLETLTQLLMLSIAVGNKERERLYMDEYIRVLSSPRYFARKTVAPRDDHFYTHQFSQYTDAQFRTKFRTSREGFRALLSLIQDHRVFHNNSNYKQTHPGWQLAIVLHRFGHTGNRASIANLAIDFNVSEGTITELTKRVITALTDLSPQ